MRHVHAPHLRPALPGLRRFRPSLRSRPAIFSKTREENLAHVRMRLVLETLRHHRRYAKASKCQFGRSSEGFLDHVISERGVAVEPRKVAALAEWVPPASCTDVRRFANYYRKFVRRFSKIAAPMATLRSPRARFT